MVLARPTIDSTTPRAIVAREKAKVAGERIVAQFPARLLGCARAGLQVCEERIGSIINIEDMHRGEREHRRVIIWRDLNSTLC